jgi:membrane protein implicated in regulation of membrane protease activity
LRSREAPVAHWPKTVRGNLFTFVLIVLAAPVVVSVAISLSGPVVWATLVVLAATPIVIYAWRRRVETAKQAAYVGGFTFGDAVGRMRTRETEETRVEVERRARLLSAR